MANLIIIGGGAAGVFASLIARERFPKRDVLLVEKTAHLLAKVRISGGGRCNVTHACFEPKLLCKNYPRGEKELLGPFFHFQPKDIIEWFEKRGVRLKVEKDGRIFPVTDSSETIIRCLLEEAKKVGVEILCKCRIEKIEKEGEGFKLTRKEGEPLFCSHLLLATGSSSDGHVWAQALGHTIEKPVPSLFTFNVPTSPLKELSGLSCPYVKVSILGTSFSCEGALLITHFGFSGPVVLKLSSWGAKYLHEKNYHVRISINWVPQCSQEEIFAKFKKTKNISAPQYSFSKNLWAALIGEKKTTRLSDLSFKELQKIAEKLHSDVYQVEGKTTHKEEFVTCGGVSLKEVNFKTMESKLCPRLFFAGEILDIDGITGGFNFQNAWTTGFIAGMTV